jgi:O-antigen/teichoic acid export membrane protein
MTAERLLPQRVASRARPLLDRVDAVIGALAGQGHGEAGRVSLIAFAIRIANAAIAFVSQVLLARWMGSFDYGIFVLVWTTMIIVGNIACFGLHTSVIRFIPQYRESGQLALLRGVLFGSRLGVLVASTALAAAGAFGIWLFSPSIESYYLVPFWLGLVCLPMIALSDMLQGIARANAWAVSALASAYLIRPVLILVCMVVAMLLGFAHDAVTAVWCAVVATYLTTIWQLVSVTHRVDSRIPAGPRRYETRLWIAVSLPIFLVEAFFFLLTNADVLMVGAFLDPHDVAVYYATVKTLALVHFVYFSVKAGVAQRYAQLATEGGSKLAEFARVTSVWTFWPSLAMGLVVLALGKPTLLLFGPGFDEGYPLLFVLVLGVVARAAVGPAESLLTMTGNQNVCAAIYAAALAINVGLTVWLIPLYGLWGAAFGTLGAVAFEAVLLTIVVWRRLGIAMGVFFPVPAEVR